jgi:hypothetical protein
MVSDDVKAAKERFVTGHSGGRVLEISVITATVPLLALVATFVRSFVSRNFQFDPHRLSKWLRAGQVGLGLAVDFAILVVPQLAAMLEIVAPWVVFLFSALLASLLAGTGREAKATQAQEPIAALALPRKR